MSNNIRALRKARGWTMRELGERLGATGMAADQSTIAKLELGRRQLTHDWIVRFANAFGVPVTDIIDDFITPASDRHTRVRETPVIGMVSAGAWREAIQYPDRYVLTPARGPNTFALIVDGDSMDRISPAGTLVVIDPDRPDLHDGSLYVIMNSDGETTFKQYRSNPARLEPCSTNAEHQTLTLGRAPFEIVGKVVGAYQDFD